MRKAGIPAGLDSNDVVNKVKELGSVELAANDFGVTRASVYYHLCKSNFSLQRWKNDQHRLSMTNTMDAVSDTVMEGSDVAMQAARALIARVYAEAGDAVAAMRVIAGKSDENLSVAQTANNLNKIMKGNVAGLQRLESLFTNA